ncbi:hypothetical protein FB451DRAFT_1455507, partial [Mycena latifolia]
RAHPQTPIRDRSRPQKASHTVSALAVAQALPPLTMTIVVACQMPWARWPHLLAGLQSMAVEPCWAMMKTCQDRSSKTPQAVEDQNNYELNNENVDEFQESIRSNQRGNLRQIDISSKGKIKWYGPLVGTTWPTVGGVGGFEPPPSTDNKGSSDERCPCSLRGGMKQRSWGSSSLDYGWPAKQIPRVEQRCQEQFATNAH